MKSKSEKLGEKYILQLEVRISEYGDRAVKRMHIKAVAEVTDGEELEMKTEQMPIWFKTHSWAKFDAKDDEGKL